jgi:hypothetical protein
VSEALERLKQLNTVALPSKRASVAVELLERLEQAGVIKAEESLVAGAL